MDQRAQQLLDECNRLLDEFTRLTAQQNTLLGAESLDTAAFNKSLSERRAVLEGIQAACTALETAAPDDAGRARLAARLAEVKDLDDANIRLAEGQAQALREQARQMTQTRRGISGYGRTDLAGAEATRFDKKS